MLQPFYRARFNLKCSQKLPRGPKQGDVLVQKEPEKSKINRLRLVRSTTHLSYFRTIFQSRHSAVTICVQRGCKWPATYGLHDLKNKAKVLNINQFSVDKTNGIISSYTMIF